MKDVPSLQPVWFVYVVKTVLAGSFSLFIARQAMDVTRKARILHQKKNSSSLGNSLGSRQTIAHARIVIRRKTR